MNNNGFFAMILFSVFTCIAACKMPVKKEAPPDERRFKRVVLAEEAQGLIGATVLDIANDGRIFIIDLSGHLRIFNPKTSRLTIAGKFDGGEFGLIGVKLDPQFESNSFIYLQYFIGDPANLPTGGGHRIMRISRFTMLKDSLDSLSEKNYLQIPYEDACCHTGGGMDFDNYGNLYISTGDNTDAFFTQYSPVVDIPNHDVITDGLRSSGNTNDDRGKILRIHPETDGTYTIPDGNLFAKGTSKTKPEIYIMGVRNPYRITIDKKTGYLFWGEVGPDAAKDSSIGPRGYDEFNRTNEAGNFGWPLVIGNNKAYPHVYYNENNRVGEKADTLHPVNLSVNNTGLKDLPATHPAMIWYPYDSSDVFKSFGAGGRTAIGGPFYQYDASLDSKVKFPAYFDHCWFIGDWMRNWIKAVHLTPGNEVESIEDFMPDTIFKKPICMKFGPDGALYILEFGSTWGENPESKLVRIEYESGNRTPIAKLDIDKAFGKIPLTINLSADKSLDYDNDSLQYTWKDDMGKTIASGSHAKLTFDKAGRYPVSLVVNDPHGASAHTDTVISAGNAMPVVEILTGNRTFYWDTLNYSVNLNDEEDGTIGKGINPSDVKVTLQYFASPYGFNAAKGVKRSRGEVLLNESDCNSCHQLNSKSVGPSFLDITQRYTDEKKAIPLLAEKILKGGSGVWGNANMSAHPQLNIDQTTEIVQYIFSLAQKNFPIHPIAVQGNRPLKNETSGNSRKNGYFILQASYTDKGNTPATPLTMLTSIPLRNATVNAIDFEEPYEGIIADEKFSGRHGSYAAIKSIDITGIKQLQLLASGNGSIDIHLDSANGPLISKALFTTKHKEEIISATINPLIGIHSIYFIFTSEDERFSDIYVRSVHFDEYITANAQKPR